MWRLALLALCLGAAAAGGNRRGGGGKSRRQAQTQTTSLPQGTAAQGKREYRPRAGHGAGHGSAGGPGGLCLTPALALSRSSARRTRTRVSPAPLSSRLLPSVTPNFAFSAPSASPFLLLSPQRPAMTMDGTIR